MLSILGPQNSGKSRALYLLDHLINVPLVIIFGLDVGLDLVYRGEDG